MMTAVGKASFKTLLISFIIKICAAEFTAENSVSAESGYCINNGCNNHKMDGFENSLVSNNEVAMSKFVAGIYSCICLVGEAGDTSFALRSILFESSLRNTMEYFIRNKENMFSIFKEHHPGFSELNAMQNKDARVVQLDEALEMLWSDPVLQDFRSHIISTLNIYSSIVNLNRLKDRLPAVEDGKRELSTLLRLFLMRCLTDDELQNEKMGALARKIALFGSIFESTSDLIPSPRQTKLIDQLYRIISDNIGSIVALHHRIMEVPSDCSDKTVDEISKDFIGQLRFFCEMSHSDN